MRYRAFLSYSRDDDRAANWLHARLDGYRIPPSLVGQSGTRGDIPAKLRPIYRDRTDMPVGGVLDDRIAAALAESESLVVLCSPSAAASRWVAQECNAFIELGRADRIFPVIAQNLPQSADLESDFFPPPLRGRGLLAADLRQIKLPTGKIIGDGRRFGVLKLIAGLLGIDLDKLIARERVRARKRFWTIIGVVGFSVIALIGAGGLAVSQTWRSALNVNQRIELRQGPKQLNIYNVVGFEPKVELRLKVDELDELNGKLQQVRDEAVIGFWRPLREGIRAWGFEIGDLLKPDARQIWLVRLGALSEWDLLTRGLAGITVPAGPEASIRETERAILAQSRAITPILWRREWRLPPMARCGTNGPAGYTDYIELLLNESDGESLQRLHGLIAAAMLSDEINGDVLIRVLTLYGHMYAAWRSLHARLIAVPTNSLTATSTALRFKERPTLEESRALVDLARLLRQRSVQGLSPLTEAQREWLRASLDSCGKWTAPVLASIADNEDIIHVRAWSRTQATADQGRLALEELAVDTKLPSQDIRFVLNQYGFGRNSAGTYAALVNAGGWLRTVASHQGLSADLANELLQFAKQHLEGNDLDRVDRSLAVLAAAKGGLIEPQHEELGILLERRLSASISPIRPVSELELAGVAELNKTKVSMLRDRWNTTQSQLPPSIAPKHHLGSGTSIEEVIALARLVTAAIAADDSTVARAKLRWFESVYGHALDAGFNPNELCALSTAEATTHPTFSPEAFRVALMSNRSNAHARLANVHVNAARVMNASDPKLAIESMRSLYAIEIEPDIKYDIAELLLLTSLTTHACTPRS